MIVGIVACALAAVLMPFGPDGRSWRAWAATGTMLCAMLAATVTGAGTTQLLAGAMALLAAPVIAVRVSRAHAAGAVHRACALLITSWCLLTTQPSSAQPATHHHPVAMGSVFVVCYVATGIAATLSERSRAKRRTARLAMRSETLVMAAGMTAMVFG